MRPILLAAAIVLSIGTLYAQITYIPAVTDATIGSHTIDVGKPVGTIAGNASVNNAGGATYTIPLALPPGTNGMQPLLALTYNSYGGDGLLGVGWSLTGLSAIQRVGSDDYHDGSTAPMKYTTADHFTLDGRRLVNTFGTYGAANATYDVEDGAFDYITPIGTYGTGPAAFKIVHKDGTIAYYGKTDAQSADALVLRTSSTTEALGWLLTRKEDPFGNTIRYLYSNNNDLEAKRIVRIEYTSNPGQGIAAYNTVDFDYNGRTDKTTLFPTASQVNNDFLLQRIDVKAEGILMAQYELRYAKRQQDVSYLSELVQRGVGGAELNSTIFKYGDLSVAEESTSTALAVGQGQQYVDMFTGDYDGNGKTDILLASFFYYTAHGYKYHTQFSVYLNGSATATYTASLADAPFLPRITNYAGGKQLLSTDVDGDGRDDVVVTYVNYSSGPDKFYLQQVKVWKSFSQDDDADFTMSSAGIPDGTFKWLYPESPREYLLPGDFDGDGRTELAMVLYTDNWNSVRTYMWSDGLGWAQQSLGASIDNHIGNAQHLNLGDFNGDGQTDLMSRNDDYASQCRIATMTGTNSWSEIISSTIPTADQDIHINDFNGDGTQDVMVRNLSSTWQMDYFYGTGVSGPYNFTISPVPGGSDPVETGDINGDGKCDIFWGYYNSVTAQYRSGVAYSKGLLSGTAAFELKNYLSPTSYTWSTNADMNGDGKMDILTRGHYSNPTYSLRFNAFTHERRLDKVEDGLGFLVDFDYKYLTDPAVYGEDTEVFESPDADYDVPLPLVWKLKTSNGVGTGMNTQTHTYRDAWGWRNGPGFSGFYKHIIEDGATDRRTEERYTGGGSVAGMFLTGSDVTDMSTGTMLTTRAILGGPFGLGPSMNRYQYRVSTTTETDLLANTQTIQSNLLFDNYGNVKSAQETVGGILTTASSIPTFGAYGPYPYPSKPATVQVTSTRSGSPALATTTAYTYDAATGNVTQMVEFQDKPIKTTTDYLYWPTGNLKQTTLYYTGLATNDRRVESWTYEPKYRFPATFNRKWNNGGVFVYPTETFTYDAKWGKVLTELSADQLQVDHVYDAFGRPTSVSAPYTPGAPRYTVTRQYGWDVVAVENKYHYVLVSDPGAPDVKTWYDLVGREVEQQSQSFATGAWTKSNKSYDPAGRDAVITLPRLTGETAQTVTHGYDALGRLSTMVNSFSGSTTYGYSYASGKLTTSVTTSAGHVSSATMDATDKLVSAHDDGGDLTYTYDSWGNLLTMAHGSLTQATNTYDVYGRQTKLVDADGGTTEYLYNAFGLLTWQKNPNLQVTTMVYDNLGRLKSRTEPEGTTTWAYYYEGGKFNDNLVTETGLGYTRSYTYDAFRNMTFESRAGLGKQYTYDPYDRIATVRVDQQPMQVQLDYAYTNEGHLNTVMMGTQTLFDGVSMNGLGRYKQYILADGKTTTVTYDQQYRTRVQATGVQDLEMAYNATTGTLTSRWDRMKDRKEDFTYDALDRLTGATTRVASTTALVTSLAYIYDGSVGGTTRGNLIQRTDIGKFNYTDHAPTRAFGVTPGSTPPNVISQLTETVGYTSFLQPTLINEPTTSTSGVVLGYAYGGDHQRTKSTYWDASDYPGGPPLEERWYGNGLERQRFDGGASDENVILYVQGGDGICAMIVASYDGQFTQTIYSVYKDHLGSIVALTKKVGAIVTIEAEQNFDPWGRKRNPSNWTYTGIPAVPGWLYRGFTGHEHLPSSIPLINMNGRMYDPLNGRMLAVDRNIAGLASTSAMNRYAYANNNPMQFTDPDGELAWFVPVIVGAAIGAYAGGAIDQGTLDATMWDWHDRSLASSMIVGGLLGASAGAGFSAAASAGGWNVLGLGQITGFQTSSGVLGATGAGWNMVSNGLLTASVNIGTSYAQGLDIDQVAANGLIGLGAGGLGGLFGVGASTTSLPMPKATFLEMNSLTAMINGAGTRAYASARMGLKTGRVLWNSVLGAAEGWLSAAMVGNKIGGIKFSGNTTYSAVIGRYVTGTLTQGMASVPGAGFVAASYVAMPWWAVKSGLYGTFGFGAQPLFNHLLMPGPDKYPYAWGSGELFQTSYAELLHALIFGPR